ncbi:MAG: hypothetical protein AAFX10_15355, partial [Pseudomonadota bacterium]
RVALSYQWLGETEQALEFFQRAERLGARGATHLLGYALLLTSIGDIEAARRVASGAVGESDSEDWIDAVLDGVQDPARREHALASVDRASADGRISAQVEVVTRIVLDDTDGAMRVAERLREPGEAFEMDLLWIPAFEPLRRRPEFATLIADLGLVDYWATAGCELRDAEVRCKPR